jgi:hypothetical protein
VDGPEETKDMKEAREGMRYVPEPRTLMLFFMSFFMFFVSSCPSFQLLIFPAVDLVAADPVAVDGAHESR